MKKKFFVIGTVLAMLVIMVFPCYGADDGIIKGCYQKENGQLRIFTYQKDCDKGRNKDCDKGRDKDCDKDCDKDGYTNKCKPSEIPISWNQIGPPGPQGPKGDPGAPGAPGKDGKTILSGTVDPTGDGKEGDLYLNTSTNTLFGPKTSSGEWPLIGTIARTCSGYVAGHNCTATSCPFTSSCISSVEYIEPGKYQINFTISFGNNPICVFYIYPLIEDPLWIKYSSESPFSAIISRIYQGDGSGWDLPFNFICTEP